jgi:hypothetical protein
MATATRCLAAILAADVVGYSRLMGADEEGTHERVKAHLIELLDPKIREHHGRIVKTTGDGVLAEFASVVDAVRRAGEIQRAMYLLQPRIDEAIFWLEKARNGLPGLPHAFLTSAYGLKGDTERAAAELAEARRLSGDNRYSSIAHLKVVGFWGTGYWGVPKIRALLEATYFVGLRKAGMPEE